MTMSLSFFCKILVFAELKEDVEHGRGKTVEGFIDVENTCQVVDL
jgi:hypothetical protein